MLTAKVTRKRIAKIPNTADVKGHVKVGLVKGKADTDNINKAVWNEFGTAGGASGGGWGGPIPERPFMRNAMKENASKYGDAMARSAAKILRGEASVYDVLNKLGVTAQQDIKRSIDSLKSPPNSPVTIARKGSSKPLIDTGEMRNSVSYEVKK